MISAMVSDARGPARSWQKSTSPFPPASARRSRQRARIWRSIRPMTWARERRCKRLAVRGVLRRVHHQEHATGVFELRRIRILEHHAAEPTREQVRVPRDVHHVGVAKHGPEPRFARHVLPMDRIGPAELSEDAMDVVAQVPVGRVKIVQRGVLSHLSGRLRDTSEHVPDVRVSVEPCLAASSAGSPISRS